MKNTTILAIVVIIIIAAGVFVFANSGKSTGNVISNSNGNTNTEQVQKVVLSVKDFNYYPQVIRVKVNQPVSISLDSSVTGCLRSFTIKDFGIAKNLPTPQDTVDFTPTQKGTYGFACSMGMGTGTLIVE